jgi:hypothetical protein
MRAAWALFLWRYTGLQDVCFGFEEVGGASPDAAGSAIAVVHIDENMSLKALLGKCEEQNHSEPSNSHDHFEFNTSVLVRRGASTSTTSAPYSSAMSEKVCLTIISAAFTALIAVPSVKSDSWSRSLNLAPAFFLSIAIRLCRQKRAEMPPAHWTKSSQTS